IDWIVAVGKSPKETIEKFYAALDEPGPDLSGLVLTPGEVLLWSRKEKLGERVHVIPGRTERRRHIRKYAEGELPPERSFYFHGPEGKLNLRAQNLILFMQLADGVDDDTWTHQLRAGDYSRWFREEIKDDDLAEQARQIER